MKTSIHVQEAPLLFSPIWREKVRPTQTVCGIKFHFLLVTFVLEQAQNVRGVSNGTQTASMGAQSSK